MKKLVLIISIILCFNIYSQVPEGWNPIDTNDVPTIAGERIALFANHSGIHLLQSVHITGGPSNAVKYYRLKSTGEIDDNFPSAGIILDTYGDFPNLTGDEDNLYIVYQKDGTIQAKKSNDGGDSWNPEASYPFLNGITESNGVDAAYTLEKGLHIVWSQKEDTLYESYFARWYNGQWLNYTQITNHPTLLPSGGLPTITTSNINGVQKVHVCINTGTGSNVNDNSGQNFSRDFDYSNWANPIQILPTGTLSKVDRMLVTNDGWMHSFYYTASNGYEYRKKTIESNSWSAPLLIDNSIGVSSVEKIHLTKTTDQMLHAFWIDPDNGWGSKHRKKSSSDINWSTIYNVTGGGVNQRWTAVTSSSNDLYVVWSHNYSVTTQRFRQYDAIPLAPQNLTVTKSANNHPLLNWNRNNETDLQHYIIYKKITEEIGFVPCSTSTTNSFEDVNESYPKPGGIGITHPVSYKITAVDLHPFESLTSNVVSTMVSGASPEKIVADPTLELVPAEYSLQQNYPNPFNPTTKISYSIKKEGLVTLKVYDVLGKEVATLVNESKPEGNYEVDFNASKLPSGMYIYKIQAGDFKESKKMLLMK